ncbi:MAG: amidohydrolase family protein [Deltaproteobacteria bacterium]|nr:amidohydrolase family protein [Deltaproteobacteria bacterium]
MSTGLKNSVEARKEGARLLILLMVLFTVMLCSGAARAESDLPLFDAHVHYNREAWEGLTAEAAIAILDRAGVVRALVSSTPDDGTLRLLEQAPDRIVPELRPYRSQSDMGTWTKDPSVLAYVTERLRRGIYRGIGEFHLSGEEVNDPVPRGFVELASRHGILLHCHCDEKAIRDLASMAKGVRILWAHAGMNSSAQTVKKLLDAQPNLWVELSMRSDISPGGVLVPAWRDLFLKHPDRFLVGTDTWINSQWEGMPENLDGFRKWLRQLPPAVAEKIARGNGDRLFSP